jgi:phage tail sheath protein FI
VPQYLSPGVYVEEVPPAARPIGGVGTSTAAFLGIVPDSFDLPGPRAGQPGKFVKVPQSPDAQEGEAVLITSWAQFVTKFADLVGEEQATGTPEAAPLTVDEGFRHLAHAVFGFFNNGGTRCYVVRVGAVADIGDAIAAIAPIDEIAVVTIPGRTTKTAHEAVIDHCELLEDRFAVLDGIRNPAQITPGNIQGTTKDSPYAALYWPWIEVSDPSEMLMRPDQGGVLTVPPSGHVAGVFARVDGARGVHKAPANEPVRGALEVETRLAKADQDGLNPEGINVIRAFNGNIKVWGARTLGGAANGEFMYVSTRRFFNFLRESIDEGTQFVVFEPNTPALWQRITRSVSDFLLNQWRIGALFGETPKQAFFVKCDEETNPPEVREAGQVVTEIGVAIVKPAEFVIFRIQQTTGG